MITQKDISDKIIKSFNLIKGETPLYHIVINPREVIHIGDLRFNTNVYLHSLMRNYQYKFKPIKFLFVIEYSGDISKGIEADINRLGEHVHLLLSTDLNVEVIKSEFYTTFKGLSNTHFERIDNHQDINNFYNYLIKQEKYFSKDSVRTNLN
jgi:hypothetical protein